MKRDSKLHKIRQIAAKKSRKILGLTIPNTFEHWNGIYVNIKESGSCLILESGAVPFILNKKEINQNSRLIETVTL
mgnify:CR=1 FL=1